MSTRGQELPMWNTMPFTAKPLAIYDVEKGIVVSTSDEPILMFYSLDGTLKSKVILDLPSIPITQKDKATHIAGLDSRIRNEEREEYRRNYQSMKENVVYPQHKAFWNSISVDDAGYIWLQVLESREEREQAGSSYKYYVLSPEGELLGITRTPTTGTVVGGCHLGIVADPDTGEFTPTVWRLIPQPEGFRYPN